MKRLLAAVAAIALAAPACANRVEPTMQLLGRAAERFGTVRRATVDLTVTMTAGQGKPVGFTVTGPVDLDHKPVPLADLTFTQLAGSTTKSVRIVADGRDVYAVGESGTHRLPPGTLRSDDFDSRVSSVRLDRWLRSPRQSDGGTMDGIPVRRFDAGVDVATALSDIAGLLRELGQAHAGGLGTLQERDFRLLKENVQDATMTVWAGRDHDLVRKLTLHLTLGRPRRSLPPRVAAMVPLDVGVSLTLTRVGAPVPVPQVSSR